MDTVCKVFGIIIACVGLGLGALTFQSAAASGQNATAGLLLLAAAGYAAGGLILGVVFAWMGRAYEQLKKIRAELERLNFPSSE